MILWAAFENERLIEDTIRTERLLSIRSWLTCNGWVLKPIERDESLERWFEIESEGKKVEICQIEVTYKRVETFKIGEKVRYKDQKRYGKGEFLLTKVEQVPESELIGVGHPQWLSWDEEGRGDQVSGMLMEKVYGG